MRQYITTDSSIGVFLTSYCWDHGSCLHWELFWMFGVQQQLLCRLMTLTETQTSDWRGTNQHLISPKPFRPLGRSSGLMLMTSFCPPHDEQTGPLISPLMGRGASFSPLPLIILLFFSPFSVFLSFFLLALLFYIAAELNQLLACDTECQMPSCPHYGASRGTPPQQKAFISHAFPEYSNLLPTKHKGSFLWAINIFVIIIIISYLYTLCFTQTNFCLCC